jgi:hypothetical protein
VAERTLVSDETGIICFQLGNFGCSYAASRDFHSSATYWVQLIDRQFLASQFAIFTIQFAIQIHHGISHLFQDRTIPASIEEARTVPN